MVRSVLQTALRAIYPPECMLCRSPVAMEFGLCAECWRETPFLGGAVCDACGTQLPGPAEDDVQCDQCMDHPRGWDRGRAALRYGDQARRLVLALKHGDRQDIARPAARWMAQAARPMLTPETLIAPVPLHWLRQAKRRYNQSLLLAQGIAHETGHKLCADLLQRPRRTPSLEGQSIDERQATLSDAIRVNPRRKHMVANGRPVLLVDDVLTTGATLEACTAALRKSQAGEICVIVLARAEYAP